MTEAQLPAAYQAIDKIERRTRAALTEQLEAAGIAGGAIDRVFEIAALRGLDDGRGGAGRGSRTAAAAGVSLRRVLDALDAMGAR